jgi:two-component system response regulator PilR (NtrC family)
MSMPKALIVDDEPDIRELVNMTLSRMGIECHTAGNLREARTRLAREEYAFCISDMNMPDGSGLELVSDIQRDHAHMPIAILTAYGSMETAVSALKAGAFDFVSKPVELGKLREMVAHALRLSSSPVRPDAGTKDASPILGQSEPIKTLRAHINKLARSQAPVYISGESGAGKEMVARQIHRQGPRADAPFVPVNCGAIPAELMESEFFGHRKGSFSGAYEDKPGLFQAAHGGTLFLDEVADLPMHMQVKLLRALQERAVRPVGATREMAVDARILTATHRDLSQLVERGEFRQDLFYRINVIQLHVPPLRERREDIPLLANAFLAELSSEWQIPVPRLSRAAMDQLQGYRFPGNVRELENILERALTLAESDLIEPEHLQLRSLSGSDKTAQQESIPDFDADGASLETYLSDIEKSAIMKALEDTRWNRTAAARKLGMSFRSLRYRLKKLGIDAGDDQED